MEEKNNNQNPETVEDENKNIEETGDVGTQANKNKDEGNSAKTYSQEEYNALDKKLKEKYEKKYGNVDLKKYNEWLESQKTEEQKKAEKETAYQKAISDLAEKENYIAVLESGVNKEDSDYVLFKVSKMDGDFKDNLEDFLKENPKYTQKNSDNTSENNVTDGVSVKNSNVKKDDGVTAILKQKHPELFN
jgi:hypothetical protein